MTDKFKNIIQRVFLILTVLLAAFPILPFGVRSLIIITWAILGVYNSILSRGETQKTKWKRLMFFIAAIPFLTLCVSLLYTEHTRQGLDKILQTSGMLVFPLVLYLSDSSNIFLAKKYFKKAFIYSTLTLVCYLSIKSILNYDYLLSGLFREEIISNGLSNLKEIPSDLSQRIIARRFRNFIQDISGTQATYLASWIVFAAFLILKELISIAKNKYNVKTAAMLIGALVLLVIWSVMIASRAPLIGGVIGSILSVFLFDVKRKFKAAILAALIIFVVLIYNSKSNLKSRITEVFNTEWKLPKNKNGVKSFNATNVRYGIYYCAYKVALTGGFWGVGVGDVEKKLNECFEDELDAKIYSWRNYNSHNQYLFFLLSSGLLGFASYIGFLVFGFFIAIRNDHSEYFFLMMLLGVTSLTENVLVRSDGIMFFIFFNAIYLFDLKKVKD